MFDNADLVFSYSRAQAIADGTLVDVTPFAARLNFKIPVALTVGVYAALIEGSASDVENFSRIQNTLAALRAALHEGNLDQDRCSFAVPAAPRDPIDMWALCGPGDTCDPVLTIMLPHED